VALEFYSEVFWLPDATLAVNLPVQVFRHDGNVFVPLFADAAGTVPLPNPGTSTDGAGVLAFWAEAGPYWLHLDTETFEINVGMSEEQAQLSTGIAAGGDISPAPGSPPAVTIAALTGYIVDNVSEVDVAPTITRVDYPGGTVLLDAGALARTITYWVMDGAQNVIQQAARPTPQQYRESLVLGLSVFDTAASVVLETQTLPTILPQLANAHVDLADSLGPFSIDGNLIRPNGANLRLDKTAGTMFSRAAGYVSGGVVTDNPNIIMSPALTGAAFRRILQTASFPTPPAVLTVDPANYDVGGVLTPVPGGPSVSTVQRVYLFAADTPSLRIAVQYGQALYATPEDAARAVSSGTAFVAAPVTRVGALIGYLALTRTCTDLSDPTQCTFVYAGKFATP
jgi:hypothetical protein